MVGIDVELFDKHIEDDISFSQKLFKEESVFVLPGQSFNAKNHFRIVHCAPQKVLNQALNRIEEFCKSHLKKKVMIF